MREWSVERKDAIKNKVKQKKTTVLAAAKLLICLVKLVLFKRKKNVWENKGVTVGG